MPPSHFSKRFICRSRKKEFLHRINTRHLKQSISSTFALLIDLHSLIDNQNTIDEIASICRKMNQHDLRAILLKLENRLSDDDRKRFHFFLGHDVPRRIRDDPSLGGTLNLIESLFDQDKINEQDFTFLIHAFEQIKCMDAVKLLRG